MATDTLTIDRLEAQLAKRALQSLLDDIEQLKFKAKSTTQVAQLTKMQGKCRVGITTLRDANREKFENPTRNFE